VLFVVCSLSLSSNPAWSESKREQLKQQFAPQGNVMQMENVTFHDECEQASANEPLRSRRDSDRQVPFIGEYAIYQSDYETLIEEEIAFVKAKVHFEVFKGSGWVKIPLVESSVGLKSCLLNRKPSFVVREGGQYVLIVNKPGRYELNLEFFVEAKREREGGPGHISFAVLPSPISILDVEMEDTDVEIFVEPSIKIEAETDNKKTMATAVLPFTKRVTVRWSKALPKEIIPEVALEPKIYVDVGTLVSAGEGVAKCTSILTYSILQSEVSNLRISLPEDVGILEVQGAKLRDWKVKVQEGRQILDVYLNYGIKGNYTLTLVYERSIGDGSVTTEIPAIHTVGAERERGSVGIEARTNIELAFDELQDAGRIDVKELPQWLWSRATNPVLLAFKYLKYPYRVSIDVTKHSEVSVLVAAIDSASYVTLFTEEGKILTKATYYMRNNVKQFVRISLPEDARLWSCFVSGKPVKPAKDKDGKILIPLEKSKVQGQLLTQFPVEVVYLTQQSKPRLLGRMKLDLPKLDIPQNEVFWSVYLPEKFKYLRFSGDMKLISPRVGIASLARREAIKRAERRKEFDKKVPPSTRHYRDEEGLGKSRLYTSQVSMERKVVNDLRESQVQGVLPIRVDVPTRGNFYRFNKLLVTDETPWMGALYVRNPKILIITLIWIVVVGGLYLLTRRCLAFFRQS